MSLRRRLSVLVAIALAPPLLLTAYDAARWKKFLEDEAHTTALSAARFTSAEFAQIIDSGRQLMTAMANYPGVPDHEEECSSYFKSVIADIPIYREAAIIDTDASMGQRVEYLTVIDVSRPTRIPMAPPTRHSTMASTRNCRRM